MVDLSHKLSKRDLKHPEIMEPILNEAITLARGGREARNIMVSRREECQKRGYHQVGSEPQKEKTSICYDCELFFRIEDDWVKYRVQPI